MRTHSRSWRSIGARTFLAVAVVAALAAACNSILAIKDPTLEDAGGGGGSDATIDSTPIDGAIDAAVDSAIDGPPPVCTTGACCSPTGQFEPATKVCNTATEYQCNGASSCGAQPQQRTVQTSCSGTSAICDGAVTRGQFSDLGASCTADQVCELQGGGLSPRCTPCNGFGCNPTANACRPAVVYVLGSQGGFRGGPGAGVPVGGRAGADAKCATDFSSRFAALGCVTGHAHAVLTASVSDTIGTMAGTFSIPVTVPVHRADDDAPVADNWTAFINPNTLLTNAATPDSVTPANRVVWTGFNGSANCMDWTNASASGDTGDTAQKNNVLRFSTGTIGCTLNSHLLCVCWSGP